MVDRALRDEVEMFRRLALIRRFEERVADLYRDGEVPGFVHLSVGQEASAVGACWPLRPDDVITSTHRGHGHCIAKGLDPNAMMAELMAREAGTNRGRGGSMHIADPRLGIFGSNGIVAAGLPIAVGAATASQVTRSDGVTVAFFGDGAVAQGAFHESLNLAALWRLPIVFFCENNGWAEFSSSASQHPVSLEVRAAGYGVRFEQVDGHDVGAVVDCMEEIVASTRAGGGPVLVEAVTTRWRGHYEGDPERYREDDVERPDALEISAAHLRARGVPDDEIDDVLAAVHSEVEEAIARAREAPAPDPETTTCYVTAPRPKLTEPAVEDRAGEQWRVMDALNAALVAEMDRDGSVLLAGVDVSQAPFAITRGLRDRFGDRRVLDTPISETALVGLGVGAAMAGLRPVVEIMYLDFIGVCFDQILNQAAKLRYMTGGNVSVPMVLRTQFGAGRSSGSQHSQSLEALLAHIPGLTVVMPSNAADAYGLLRSAIRDPNPVVFIENRLLYGRKGWRPPDSHLVPFGSASVVRPGRNVTLVSVSRMVHDCLAAAEVLAQEGIEVEVIDLRTVAPLDWDTVAASLQRTSRLVIAHEAVLPFGIGAEIAARAADEAFWSLDAPVRRVGAAPSPAPYAPALEAAWLPDVDDVVTAVRETVRA